jgi:aryl-alcohol dehydrogenase-like predicted oxidoreductase
MYEGSEIAIGKAVADRRDEFVLVSKCGNPANDDVNEWTAKATEKAVDTALERLQTDHLDVMLLHSCGLDVLEEGDALAGLVKAREKGKVRFVGYSGDGHAADKAAQMEDIAVIETSVNICDQANIEHVLPKTRKHGIGVIAKRPIANAAWKDLDRQPGFYADYARTYTERLAKMKLTPESLGFEGDPDEVWPEIALRFTLSVNGVHCAIIGTTNPEHAKTNLAAAAKGALPAQTVDTIRKAFASAQEEDRKTWMGQT